MIVFSEILAGKGLNLSSADNIFETKKYCLFNGQICSLLQSWLYFCNVSGILFGGVKRKVSIDWTINLTSRLSRSRSITVS